MDNSKSVSNIKRWCIVGCLVVIIISVAAAAPFFIVGGIIYPRDHYAKTIHESNSCTVITTSYYQSRCSGYRGSTYACYIPVWSVSYSTFVDAMENRLNATIESYGFRTTAGTENRLHLYQVSEVTGQTYFF